MSFTGKARQFLATASILGAAALSLAAVSGADWREFRYPDEGFAITGPGQAERFVEKGADAETHAYAFKAKGFGTAFIVKVTRNMSGRDDNEQKLRDITAHNPTVIKSITQSGMNGLQFGFEDVDATSMGRILATDHKIYTMIAQGPVNSFPPLALNQWMDSFRLLEPRARK